MATVKATIKRRNGTGWDEIRPKTELDQIVDIADVTIDNLDDITDVNASSPSDGQALVYDNATSKWVPGTVASTFNGGTITNNLTVDSASFASLTLDRESTTSSSIVQFTNNGGVVGGVGGFGNDGLQFRTKDGTKMVLDASNNVGIGTDSPGFNLELEGSSGMGIGKSSSSHHLVLSNRDNYANDTSNSHIWASSGSTGAFSGEGAHMVLETRQSARNIYYKVGNVTAPQHIMNYSGNVGIGTLSPSTKMHISQSSTATALTVQNASSNGTVVKLTSTGDNRNLYLQTDHIYSNGNLYFGDNSYETIIRGSDVKIENEILHTKSSYDEPDNENFYRIKLQDQGGIHNDVGIGQSGSGNMGFNVTAGSSLLFYNGTNGEVARINSTGLGIGTTSPSSLLHISSGTSGDATLIIESDTDNNNENDNPQLQFKQDGGNTIAKAGITGDSGTVFTNSLANAAYFGNDESASVQFYTSGLARLTIREDGDVGINTTGPASGYKLDVNGKIRANNDIVASNFVDYNDGNYYVNPASTSVLNVVDASLIKAGTDDIEIRSGTISVGGDADTYYPVTWYGNTNSQAFFTKIQIYRNYNETAPSTWNTSTHKGGLLLDLQTNWGGWGGVLYDIKVNEFSELYSNMVAKIGHFANNRGFAIWLRGGTATYHFYTEGVKVDPTVQLSAYDPGNNSTGVSSVTSLSQSTITNALYFRSGALYDAGNRVATLASPALTGTPTAPTAAANTNTTQIATTAYVQQEITDLIGGAPGALDTLNELATALNNDASFSTTVTNSIATKLPLTGGTLTGTLTSRSINMQNYTLSNVGQMSFNDPGPNEGISWSGGNFSIYESPDNLTTNSSGNLQFVSGGSRRMTIGTDGYVYVGSTLHAPTSLTSAKVHITATNPILQLTDLNTSGSAYIDYQGGTSLKVHAGSDPIVFIAGNSEKARLTAGNGNLGIGTTNPSQKLEVNGNINANELHLNDTDTILKEGDQEQVRIQTPSGYVEIGPRNSSWSHFFTDRGSYYFNKPVQVDGNIALYDNNTTKLENSTGYIYELGNRVLTEASDVLQSYEFSPGSSGGSRRFVRLFTINGFNNTSGAFADVILSGSGDYGDFDRTALRIMAGERGNAVTVDVFSLNSEDTTDAPVIYYKSTGTANTFEIWAQLADYNYTHRLSVLAKQGGFTVNLDSITTTTPSGLNTVTQKTLWHSGNDGTNSGLSADKLDGQHGSYYLDYNNLSNTPTIPTNNNQLTNGAGYITDSGDTMTGDLTMASDGESTANDSHGVVLTARFNSIPFTRKLHMDSSANLKFGTETIFHSGNDGSSSGLHADLLDGQQGSYYLDYNNFTNTPSGGGEYEWEYVTVVTTTSGSLIYSSMSPNSYEYKFVVECQTTAEDTSNPYIRINNDSASTEYSYQYQSVTQTAETTESAVNVGDALTNLIYTGADLSSYSNGGSSVSTVHRAEFIYSISPYSTYPGMYTATIRGWAHTHYVSQGGSSYDGMVQSTFVGTKDNIYLTEANRIDYVHNITAGGTDYLEMRVYRREKK